MDHETFKSWQFCLRPFLGYGWGDLLKGFDLQRLGIKIGSLGLKHHGWCIFMYFPHGKAIWLQTVAIRIKNAGKMWEAQQPAAPHIWKKDRMTNDPKKSFFISAREIGRVMKSPGRFQVVPSWFGNILIYPNTQWSQCMVYLPIHLGGLGGKCR